MTIVDDLDHCHRCVLIGVFGDSNMVSLKRIVPIRNPRIFTHPVLYHFGGISYSGDAIWSLT
jgi:hypothetical protein